MEFRRYQPGDLSNLVIDETLKSVVSNAYIDPSLAWSLFDNKIRGCAGFAQMWPGVYEAWMYVDAYTTFFKYKIAILKKFIDEMENLQFHRLQATVDVHTHNHEKFMNFLGFNAEGTLEKYGFDQHDYIMYARINRCPSQVS